MQRSWEYTSYALKTFAKFTEFFDDDLFVLADDGSFGGSPDWLIPRVQVLERAAQIGLAHNMNTVLQEARDRNADFYFFHNDIVFNDGWHLPMAEERPSIIVAMTNQDVQYEVGGLAWKELLILTDYTKRAPFLKEVVKLHRQQMSGFKSVLSAPFSNVKIPREIYSAVGDFDEAFGTIGGEDHDYCLRANQAGFGVERALSSYLLHFGAKSTAGGGEKKTDTDARVAGYLKVFEEHWGPRLRKLIFDGDQSVLSDSAEARECVAAGNFKGLIEVLK